MISTLPNRAFEMALSVPLYTEWQAVLSSSQFIVTHNVKDFRRLLDVDGA